MKHFTLIYLDRRGTLEAKQNNTSSLPLNAPLRSKKTLKCETEVFAKRFFLLVREHETLNVLLYMSWSDLRWVRYRVKYGKKKVVLSFESLRVSKSLWECEKWNLQEKLHRYWDSKIFSTFFSVEKNNFVISKKIFLEKFQIPLRISIFHQ